MTNVCIAFEKFEGVTTDDTRKGQMRHRYEHINVNMIFGINIDGKYTIKELFVG